MSLLRDLRTLSDGFSRVATTRSAAIDLVLVATSLLAGSQGTRVLQGYNAAQMQR